MSSYILLANWTEQGIKSVKQSPQRLDTARELATKMKCKLRDFYMTIGPYDMVVTLDAPDDETAAKYVLALGSSGNVRTTTLRAYSEESYRTIVGGLG